MDIDENLLKLQGALSTFTDKTPCETIVKVLNQVFQDVDPANWDKMVFFLVLNTELEPEVKELLHEDENVGLLTDACSTISLENLINFLGKCDLLPSMKNIITHCPSVLSLELISYICDNTMFINGLNNLEKLNCFILYVFEKMQKIKVGFHKDSNFQKLCQCFLKLTVEMQNLFDICKFDNMICDNLICANIDTCLEIMCLQGVENFNDDPNFEIDLEKFLKISNGSQNESDYIVKLYLETLRSYASGLLKLINEWIECNEGFSESFRMTNISLVKGALLKIIIIYEIAREKFIQDVDVQNVKDYFMKTLMVHLEMCEEIEDKEVLLEEIEKYDAKYILSVMYRLIKEKELMNTKFIKGIFFSCYGKISLNHQIEVFNRYFNEGNIILLESSDFDERLTETFNKLSKGLLPDEIVTSCLLSLCMESPLKVITKICHLALSDFSHMTMAVNQLRILRCACLRKETNEGRNISILTTVLNTVIEKEDLTEKDEQNLVQFVGLLCKEQLLDDKFVEICLLDNLVKTVNDAKWKKAMAPLTMLKSLPLECSCRKSVLLACMSQILDHATWDLNCFSMTMANVRDMVIAIITEVMRKSKFQEGDKDLAWLRRRILTSWEINQVYFCDLWYFYGCDFPVSKSLYMQLMLLLHTESKVRAIIDSVVSTFCNRNLTDIRTDFKGAVLKLMPILTSQEWTALFTHIQSIFLSWLQLQNEKPDIDLELVAYNIYTTCLYCLAQDMNCNRDVMPCFEFCMRNFGKVLKQNFSSRQDLTPQTVIELLKGMLFIYNGVTCGVTRKTVALTLSPIVTEMISGVSVSSGCDDEESIAEELKHLQLLFNREVV